MVTTRVLSGSELRERRERLGLSQADVARRAGLHRRSVIRVENGQPASRRLYALIGFALAAAEENAR